MSFAGRFICIIAVAMCVGAAVAGAGHVASTPQGVFDAMRGMERLYEAQVVERDGQLWVPPGATRGGVGLLPGYFQRMAWIVREICGAGQVMTPSAGDFANPTLRPYLDKYFRGKPGVSAVDRVKLFKPAWELASDKFGSRATIYEY